MATAAAPDKKPPKRRHRKVLTIVIGAIAGVAAAEEALRHIVEDTTWFVDRIDAPSVPAPPTASHETPRPPAPPSGYDVRFEFGARSNGTATYRKCLLPKHPGHHFADWHIEKRVKGVGDAGFEKQSSTELCVRADASLTANGKNSEVDAVVTAKEVPD